MLSARTTSNKWRARHWAAACASSMRRGEKNVKTSGVVAWVDSGVRVCVGGGGRGKKKGGGKKSKKQVECPI